MQELSCQEVRAVSGGANIITTPIMLVLSPITAMGLYAQRKNFGYGAGENLTYFDMWGIAISQIFLK